jgi:SOS regulatory protein LexA
MTYAVTSRQNEILSLIKTFISETGQAPTLSEMERALGITRRAVVKHLQALEKKGLINRSPSTRGITLRETQTGQMFIDVNILGYANAGAPMVIAQEQQLGYLRIKRNILPVTKDLFALMIRGDSMNKREVEGGKLEDGNFALIARKAEVRNGDVVLAIIDNCATIKTYKRDRNIIVLYPESTNLRHQPFYLDASEESENDIYGKVIAVLSNPTYSPMQNNIYFQQTILLEDLAEQNSDSDMQSNNEKLQPSTVSFSTPITSNADLGLDIGSYLVKKPSSTFFMKAGDGELSRFGIFRGDLLVVDRSLQPQNKSIVVVSLDGELLIKRILISKHTTYLTPWSTRSKLLRITPENNFEIWGVVTHNIHNL